MLSALLNRLKLFYGFFGQSNTYLYRALKFCPDKEKYTGEIAATSFSAGGLILLSRWLEQKPASAVCSHVIFVIYLF